MLLNSQNLSIVFTGFKTSFENGLESAEPKYRKVALDVPSEASEQKFGWLGTFPKIRKWIGERHVTKLAAHDYAIKNEDFEETVSVDTNNIADDKVGIYGPFFQEMGRAAAVHPDELVFALLASGFDGSLSEIDKSRKVLQILEILNGVTIAEAQELLEQAGRITGNMTFVDLSGGGYKALVQDFEQHYGETYQSTTKQ